MFQKLNAWKNLVKLQPRASDIQQKYFASSKCKTSARSGAKMELHVLCKMIDRKAIDLHLSLAKCRWAIEPGAKRTMELKLMKLWREAKKNKMAAAKLFQFSAIIFSKEMLETVSRNNNSNSNNNFAWQSPAVVVDFKTWKINGKRACEGPTRRAEK